MQPVSFYNTPELFSHRVKRRADEKIPEFDSKLETPILR